MIRKNEDEEEEVDEEILKKQNQMQHDQVV
jgi:hypothetical protein